MLAFTPWAIITPTRIGWFNASLDRDPGIRRYWDGSRWSVPVYEDASHDVFQRAMRTPGHPDDVVPWRDLAAAGELTR